MGIKRKFSYSSTPCQTTQLRFLFKQYAINAPSLQQGTARNAGKAAAQYYYIKSFDFYFLLTTVIKDLFIYYSRSQVLTDEPSAISSLRP